MCLVRLVPRFPVRSIVRGILTTNFEGSPYGQVFKEADVSCLCLSVFLPEVDMYCGRGSAREPPRRSGVYSPPLGSIPRTTWKKSSMASLPSMSVASLVPTNFDSTLPPSRQPHLDARYQVGHSLDSVPRTNYLPVFRRRVGCRVRPTSWPHPFETAWGCSTGYLHCMWT